MVYCGRPSMGCGNCKKRRIKCDENRPHCQHCVRTSRECPGYTAEIDLLLRKEEPGRRRKTIQAPSESDVTGSLLGKRPRDEVQYTLTTDNRRRAKRRRLSSEDATQGYRSLQWLQVAPARANSVPDLVKETDSDSSVEGEVDARGPTDAVRSAQNGYTPSDLPRLAASPLDSAQDESLLSLATDAVATAIMARSTSLQHLTERAARSYGEALATTQKAMQNPAHATNDQTLLAILLLALYESIAIADHSIAAWNKHVEGAIAIVRARDRQQLAQLDSLSLFRTVRTRMLMTGLHHRQELMGHLSFMDHSNSEDWERPVDQSCNANIDPVLLDGVGNSLRVGHESLECNRRSSGIEYSVSDHSSIDEIDQ